MSISHDVNPVDDIQLILNMECDTKPPSKKMNESSTPNVPTSRFIFIFIGNNEVIIDENDALPTESVFDSESDTYSWNEIAIRITKKVGNQFFGFSLIDFML